ncbi:hypothetical protein KIN20_028701 [Parelaphostrongylus tenuis]|uniref:Uncharacterized protein n=1 Tax=Parelaphostrongylus tenuis TaxID=148309 RepID=A0AAD5R168_PARTN|nr:hypothetical protein KIN20_028701 [Parelaphostrongylus tenuis]
MPHNKRSESKDSFTAPQTLPRIADGRSVVADVDVILVVVVVVGRRNALLVCRIGAVETGSPSLEYSYVSRKNMVALGPRSDFAGRGICFFGVVAPI